MCQLTYTSYICSKKVQNLYYYVYQFKISKNVLPLPMRLNFQQANFNLCTHVHKEFQFVCPVLTNVLNNLQLL